MKKLFFYTITIITLLTVADCKRNKKENNPIEPQMILNINPKEKVEISLKGSGNATIDWGDGKIDNITLIDDSLNTIPHYTHQYSNKFTRTITITGGKIRVLFCPDIQLKQLDIKENTVMEELWCYNNQLANLDVSKSVALKGLYCYNNKLTTLNVNKNTALEWLNCVDNNFSETALNELFETLCIYKNTSTFGGYIEVFENKGADGCNKNIAEKKGWCVISTAYPPIEPIIL